MSGYSTQSFHLEIHSNTTSDDYFQFEGWLGLMENYFERKVIMKAFPPCSRRISP